MFQKQQACLATNDGERRAPAAADAARFGQLRGPLVPVWYWWEDCPGAFHNLAIHVRDADVVYTWAWGTGKGGRQLVSQSTSRARWTETGVGSRGAGGVQRAHGCFELSSAGLVTTTVPFGIS